MSKSKIPEMFFCQPWAMKQDVLMMMSGIIQRHLDGVKLSKEDIEAAIGAAAKPVDPPQVKGNIAIIPIYGIIAKRASMVNNISQPKGTSITGIKKQFRDALDNEKVEAIVLDIDSPGGSVDGVAELADFIFASRGKKPIIAYADGMMASAAYWIGSSADTIVASKSAAVGSIGVYSVMADYSSAYTQAGIIVEVIKAGEFKAAGHPNRQNSDDRVVVQESVNDYYSLFVEGIAQNRGLSEEDARDLADGRTYIGKKAMERGLVDEVKDFETFMEGFGIEAGAMFASEENKAPDAEQAGQSTENKEEVMSVKLTVEKVKAEAPEVADALIAEGTEAAQAKVEEKIEAAKVEAKKEVTTEAKDEILTEERTRVAGIFGHLETEEFSGMTEIAKKAIADGVDVDAAEDMFKAQRDADVTAAAPASPGPDAGDDADLEAMDLQERCEHEYKTSPKIREEFSTASRYYHYKKMEAEGRVHIAGETK